MPGVYGTYSPEPSATACTDTLTGLPITSSIEARYPALQQVGIISTAAADRGCEGVTLCIENCLCSVQVTGTGGSSRSFGISVTTSLSKGEEQVGVDWRSVHAQICFSRCRPSDAVLLNWW